MSNLRERIQLLADAVKEVEGAAHTLWVQWSPTLADRIAWNRVVSAQGALSDALKFLDTAMLRLPDDQTASPQDHPKEEPR